jgi:hypothetical protein
LERQLWETTDFSIYFENHTGSARQQHFVEKVGSAEVLLMERKP